MVRPHLVLALLTLAACSIDDPGFIPGDPDAGDGGGGGPDATDADTGPLRLVVTPTTLVVGEATVAGFTVALSGPPPGPILVTLDAPGDTVEVIPEFMLFSDRDWDDAEPAVVAAPDDVDTADEDATVVIQSTDVAESVTIDVDVHDDDVLALRLSPATVLDLGEGATASVEVRLSAQPAGDVDVAVTGGPAATVAPPTVRFTPLTWDDPASITVTGVEDDDVANESETLTFSSAVTRPATLDVTVVDDDALGIVPSTTSVGTIAEGSSRSFTVQLSQQPSTAVMVLVQSSDLGAVGADQTMLTFQPSGWNQPQTVMLSAVQDADTRDESPTITLSAPGVTDRQLSVAVDDDDVQRIVVSPGSLAMTEGTTSSFSVHLAYEPTAPIMVSISSQNPDVATASETSLQFTAANYGTDRTVMVTAPHDADAAPGSTALPLVSLADGLTASVGVTVTDDDPLLISTSTSALTVAEGAAASFDVRLTAQPAGTTNVAISSDVPAKLGVPAMPLQFTTGNWSVNQTVTVTALADLDLANHNVPIRLMTGGLPTATVTATINDDDLQQIVVSAPSVTVTEGQTTTVGVSLRYTPAANVTVAVSSTNPAAATAAPAMLVFSPANHATAQDVVITGTQDADAANGSSTLQLAAGATTASVNVAVTDNDALDLATSVTTVNLGEAGSAFFDVRLTAQPAGDTMVTVSVPVGSPVTLMPSSRTFTTSNWNTFQRFTVTGVNDADPDDETVIVTVASSGLTSRTVTATVDDDDVVPGLASISLSAAGAPIPNPLTPGFDPAVLTYSASVGLWLQRLQVTVTPQMVGSSITIAGLPATAGMPSAPIELALGVTQIPIVVTTPGLGQQTYRVDVSRAAVVAQQAYLKASNTGASDAAGTAIALHGNTLVVGAPFEDSAAGGGQTDNSATDSGAVYVFVRNGSGWTQQAFLKASNAAAGDQFGDAVAIDGDTLVVAAEGEDSAATGVGGNQASDATADSGAVYVFTRSGSVWTQQAYVKASNPGVDDHFGDELTLWGDTLVVGASAEDSSGAGVNGTQTNDALFAAGAVYVFTRTGTVWSQQAYIKASNPGQEDYFGHKVALWGDTLAVASVLEDSSSTGVNGVQANETFNNAGAVYVFTRSGGVWSQQAYLKASNTGPLDNFGNDIALWADTLVVGTPLEDSSATGVNGSQTNNNAFDSGAVYVFVRAGTTWTQQAYVKASTTANGDEFGRAVALHGDTMAIHAPGEDSAAVGIDGNQADESSPQAGAVFVFHRTGSSWVPRSYVKASNPDSEDRFGFSLRMWGDTIVVGTPSEDSAATGVNGTQSSNAALESGAVYVLR